MYKPSFACFGGILPPVFGEQSPNPGGVSALVDKELPRHVSFSKMEHSPLNNREKRAGFYKGLSHIGAKKEARSASKWKLAAIFTGIV